MARGYCRTSAIGVLAAAILGACQETQPSAAPAPALHRAADIIAEAGPDFVFSNEAHDFAGSRYVSACWLEALSARLDFTRFGAETFFGRGPVTAGGEDGLIARSGPYVRMAHFEDLLHGAGRHGLIFLAYDDRTISAAELDALGLHASPFNQRAGAAARTLLAEIGPDERAFVHTGPGHPDRRYRADRPGRRGWVGALVDRNSANRAVALANHRTRFPSWAQNAAGPCPPGVRLDDAALLVDLEADTLRCAARSARPDHAPLFDVYTIDPRMSDGADVHLDHSVAGCSVRSLSSLTPPDTVSVPARIFVRQTDALGRLTVTWRGEMTSRRPIQAPLWPDAPTVIHWYWLDEDTGERRSASVRRRTAP